MPINPYLFASEVDFTQVGIGTGVVAVLFWFLKGPFSSFLEIVVKSILATHEKMIETMDKIQDRTTSTASMMESFDRRLEAHTTKATAAQDQILAEIRVLGDAKKP